MTDAVVLHLAQQTFVIAATLSGPILLTALVIGVSISLLQALTQVQEMTLTFVPKILAVGIVMLLTGSWILHSLVDFTRRLFENLAQYAQ